MKKPQKHVWITCSTRLEPVYATLRNGKAHCTACGEFWPTQVEGIEAPPESEELPSEPVTEEADAA